MSETWEAMVQSEVGFETFAKYQYRIAENGKFAEIRFQEDDHKIHHITYDPPLVAPTKDEWPGRIASGVYHWYQDGNNAETVPADCLNSPAFQGIEIIPTR